MTETELQQAIAREVAEQIARQKESCGCSDTQSLAKVVARELKTQARMMPCGADTRISSVLMRQSLKKRTGMARYTGGPLKPGNSTFFEIPAFPIGWKMGPFNFSVVMNSGGIPSDIGVSIQVDDEELHQFSANEYEDFECCAVLRRCVDVCLGYETVVKIVLTHNGQVGDPDMLRATINFKRIFETDLLWSCPMPADKLASADIDRLVAAYATRMVEEGRLGQQAALCGV